MATGDIPISVYDPNLAHNLKRVCSKCFSDILVIEDVTSNAGAKGVEGLWIQCVACGYTELIDFETMGATANYT